METQRPDCKGCSATVRLTPAEAEAAFTRLNMPRNRIADEAEYGRRMALCLSCEDFEYGTTCRYCGCLMQVRARLAPDGCPHPAGSRWRRGV